MLPPTIAIRTSPNAQHPLPSNSLARDLPGEHRSEYSPSRQFPIPLNPQSNQPGHFTSRAEPQRPPSSPLLHTRFRSSTATESSDRSQYTVRGSAGREPNILEDDASVYSVDTAPQNYHSHIFQSGAFHPSPVPISPSFRPISDNVADQDRNSWQSDNSVRRESDQEPFGFRQYESFQLPLPKVVISSPPAPESPQETDALAKDGVPFVAFAPPIPSPSWPTTQGRAPSSIPANRNFSRPGHPPVTASSDQHKRQVLERNAHRAMSPVNPSSPNGSPTLQRATSSPALAPSRPLISRSAISTGVAVKDALSLGSKSVTVPQGASSALNRSPSWTPPRSLTNGLFPASSPPSTSSQSVQSGSNNITLTSAPIALPPSKSNSIYSSYSFYQLDSRSPSPSGTATFPAEVSRQGQDQPHWGPRNAGPHSSTSAMNRTGLTSPAPPPQQPHSSEEYLQLGIAHHEANRLEESAYCFEKSATENGGCGVGMLMWGLSLRHAWGCPKDEKKAFKWLKRAAEHTVVDLQAAKDGRDALKTELVLAVYEVGQCFFRGWGVPQDKKMGVSYFQTAAELGDPDAQQELAFCLANGKGCKKDRKAAAKWYRAAVEQGASTVGLAWIYKPKYTE